MSDPVLESDEDVHLWTVHLRKWMDHIDAVGTCLSPDELERAGRYYAAEVRQRFTIRRAALRHIVAKYIGAEPLEVAFRHADKGKPMIAVDNDRPVHFSSASSGDLCLIAVARGGRVGVDVELASPIPEQAAVVREFFSKVEREYIRRAGRDGAATFYRFWTAKEAYLKATGVGLEALHDVECCVTAGEVVRLRSSGVTQANWTVIGVNPSPGYIGCVAIDRAPIALAHFVFSFSSTLGSWATLLRGACGARGRRAEHGSVVEGYISGATTLGNPR